jgi:hypothetical protein
VKLNTCLILVPKRICTSAPPICPVQGKIYLYLLISHIFHHWWQGFTCLLCSVTPLLICVPQNLMDSLTLRPSESLFFLNDRCPFSFHCLLSPSYNPHLPYILFSIFQPSQSRSSYSSFRLTQIFSELPCHDALLFLFIYFYIP